MDRNDSFYYPFMRHDEALSPVSELSLHLNNVVSCVNCNLPAKPWGEYRVSPDRNDRNLLSETNQHPRHSDPCPVVPKGFEAAACYESDQVFIPPVVKSRPWPVGRVIEPCAQSISLQGDTLNPDNNEGRRNNVTDTYGQYFINSDDSLASPYCPEHTGQGCFDSDLSIASEESRSSQGVMVNCQGGYDYNPLFFCSSEQKQSSATCINEMGNPELLKTANEKNNLLQQASRGSRRLRESRESREASELRGANESRELSRHKWTYFRMIRSCFSSGESKMRSAEIIKQMEISFPHILSKRKNWRNTVRHTLTTNKRFVREGEDGKVGEWRYDNHGSAFNGEHKHRANTQLVKKI